MLRLGESARIGTLKLKNRIVMPPMVTQYGSRDGFVTERTSNYYAARAKGGAALIIIEATYVHKSGHAFVNQLGISDDRFIPGMSELVRAIHKYGAKVALQIHHGGRMARSELSGVPTVAPSPIASPTGEVPRELSIAEIQELVEVFADAAVRARTAGFDGVEIHGAHGYLIDQFLSRSTNKRQDAYGGNLANRARFLVEVIRAVRLAVGREYPVWCRINGREYGIEQETTLEDAQETAKMAAEAGVDAIDVTAFGPTSPVNLTAPAFTPAVIEHLAEGIKKAVDVPVIAVGRITPEAGEKIIGEGKADFVAIGKGMLADPEIANKCISGGAEDICSCILCMSCRDDLLSPDITGIRCSVNAALGKEREYEITPAAEPKKVLVIGGGPAGMEAARVAAQRGHRVTLWERRPKLGGQLVQAAIAPHKDRIRALTSYLETQMRKNKVDLQLAREATTPLVEEFSPDVLILATGVLPLLPDIPGLDEAGYAFAGDVLEGKAEIGQRVVIIGGELVGCETAEYLADRGKEVTVTRRKPEMATKVGPVQRQVFLNRLIEKGIQLMPNVSYKGVNSQGIAVIAKDGAEKTIEADTIVLATGAKPDNSLLEELKGKVPSIYTIGDCVKPRKIRDAIDEGFMTALEI